MPTATANALCVPRFVAAAVVATAIAACLLAPVAPGQSSFVVGWGENSYGACNATSPPPGMTFTGVATSVSGVYARRSDGHVDAWGGAGYGLYTVPPLPPGLTYTQVAAGPYLGLALRSDGTVAAWGLYSAIAVPALPVGVSYVAVTAGGQHGAARRSDGVVVAWGNPAWYGQLILPLPAGLTYVEISAGEQHTLARRSDGSVVGWGSNFNGELLVPPLPPGVTYVRVAAGSYQSMALRSDGTVVSWGDNTYGQSTVPALPPGVTYVEIVNGGRHSVARRTDGVVVAWGWNAYGQCNVPALPTGFACVGLAAGVYRTLARYEYQPPQVVMSPAIVAGTPGTDASLSVGVVAVFPVAYQWLKNGVPIVGATSSTLTMANAQIGDTALYTCAVLGPQPPATMVSAPVYITSNIGNYIGLSQPFNAGSLSIATHTGNAAYAGHRYFNFATFAPGIGNHNFFGLHADLGEILNEISWGPPFYGTLDGGGNANFVYGPGVLSAFAGLTLYVQGVIFTPAGALVGASTTATRMLQ